MRRIDRQQQLRYLNDAAFHARVEVVALALWETVSRLDFKHTTPYPYDDLIQPTKDDLVVYAIAAVEALEVLEAGQVGVLVAQEENR